VLARALSRRGFRRPVRDQDHTTPARGLAGSTRVMSRDLTRRRASHRLPVPGDGAAHRRRQRVPRALDGAGWTTRHAKPEGEPHAVVFDPALADESLRLELAGGFRRHRRIRRRPRRARPGRHARLGRSASRSRVMLCWR
jgi:hypothetical protein